MRIAIVGAALLLGGCAVLPFAGAGGLGFAAGSFANPLNDLQDANAALKLDAPLKYLDCALLASEAAVNPGLRTYCDHIPTSIGDALLTWGLVFDAMRTGTPR